MHELSIAKALVQLAERHRPAAARVRAVLVQAGPLQAIDRQALQWAWQAATRGTEFGGADLELELLPWRLRCPACGCRWQAETLDSACSCGSCAGVPEGGDELLLASLEIEETNATPDSSVAG